MKTLEMTSKNATSENKRLIRLLLELDTELGEYQQRIGYNRHDSEVRTMIRLIEILLMEIVSDS